MMKRRSYIFTGSLMIVLAASLVLTGCGKKKDEDKVADKAADAVVEETKETVDETEATDIKEAEPEEIQAKEEDSLQDNSAMIDLYEAFVNGKEPVYTDFHSFEKNDEEGDTDSYYGDNDGLLIGDFLTRVIGVESYGSMDISLKALSYAIIDCAWDDVPELAVRAEFDYYGDSSIRQYVIKAIDDKLELCYQDYSFASYVDIELSNNGYIQKNCFYNYASFSTDYAFLDADCDYNYFYGQLTNYKGYGILDDRFDDDIVYGEIAQTDAFMKAYSFEDENIVGYKKWREDRWYCVEKADEEESNGIDMDKNAKDFSKLFEETGVELHSLDEVNKKIESRKKELGLTDELMKMIPIEWTEVDFDCDSFNRNLKSSVGSESNIEGKVITIIPYSESNYRWEGPINVYITDSDTNEKYHFSDETKINEELPCGSKDCDSMMWLSRYLEHSAILDESDPDDPYFCMGVAPGDVWEIEVDDNNNILRVISISYWD